MPAVDDHRAGAAGAAIADALVAGQVGAHAQRVEQRDPRLDPEIETLAVDHEADRHLAWTDGAGAAGDVLGLDLRGWRRRSPR